MAEPGIYGFERRQETADANAGAAVPPAAQINVGGVQTPRGGDFSNVTAASAELAQSLGDLGGTVGEMFARQRQDWRLEGQLQAAQGMTEDEIYAKGNFYTAQGAKVYNAQTAFQEWSAEALANIDYKDHQEDPTAYRERLTKQFSELSQSLSGDKLVQKFASEQASSILPKLVSAQTVAHNKFNRDNLREAFANNLTSAAGMIDPVNPGKSKADLAEKLEPGASGLPIAEENLAQSAAIASELARGSSNLYEVIGGREGMAARGFTAEAISGVEQAYGRYQAKQDQDYASASSAQMQDIINQADISQDPIYAGKMANEFLMNNRGTQQWAKFVARSTDRATLALTLDKLYPQATGAQSVARIDRLMGSFDELTQLYADKAVAVANGDATGGENFTGRAQAIAEKTGLSQQDIEQVLGTFDQQDNRIGIDLMASVKAKVQASLDAETKLNEGLLAWNTGTLGQLSAGDQQKIISAKWADENARAEAQIAAGNGGGKTANQIAEAKIIPHLAAMGIVDKGMADSISNSFMASVIDPKTHQISQNAISAYDTLRRFQQEYGLTPAQVDGYVSGYSSKLYHQALALDVGDQDTATALTAAKNLIDRPEDIAMFQEKIDNEAVVDAADEIVGGFWGFGGMAGPFTRFGSQGLSGISMTLKRELDRAAGSPEFQADIRAEAMLQKANNPSMSPEGALSKAKATIQNRSTFVGGSIVTTRPGAKTLPQAMGLEQYDSFTPNAAVMLYIREHGKELFGSAWDERHYWDGFENDETIAGNVIANLGASDTFGTGAKQFRTTYDSDSGTFIFELYADNTMQATIPSGKFVSAKMIGDAYRKAEEASTLERAQFWADTMKKVYKAAPVVAPMIDTPILLQE